MIWSVGIILYKLLLKTNPFEGKSEIQKQNGDYSSSSDLIPIFSDIVYGMLSVSPSVRIQKVDLVLSYTSLSSMFKERAGAE